MQEIFNQLGIDINLSTLSAGFMFKIALLILVGIVLIRILMGVVDRLLQRSKSLASIKVYIRSAIRVGLWLLLGLVVAGALDVDVTSIIALLSVAGLAVSLALQSTLSNLAGGMMLLITKPFQVGDYIEADGVGGTVYAIDLSYTTFTTIDNKKIFVPNSQLSGAKIINYTAMQKRRVDLSFHAAYDAPTQVVKDAIWEVLEAIPQITHDPAPPEVRLAEFQNSSIRYLVRVWTPTQDYWPVYYTILEQVRESFARHGVEMTYEHLNVHLIESHQKST